MLAGEQFGRYEIRGKIGEGGMGEVYSAMDLELDRNVAIKLLPNEFTADDERRLRFRQEAKVVSSLNHPNVITIYEIGENDFGHFLATEFVEGKTLREIIRRESLTLPRILKIVEQAANALVAAHHERIVHRDVKPENIMVRRDGIVKVLDFGLAKPVTGFERDDSSENKTIPGTVMGSARYMSPEQARGLDVDERTDIWSLGVVLYELLVGKAPFDGKTTADTLAAVIYHEPEPISLLLPNVPFELQRILRKALQKDREERYQDVKDFALDIKELLHDLEHANSGNRSSHAISNPNFSENPTIIHRTVSGNHSTDKTSVMTSMHAFAAQPQKRRRWPLVLAAIVLPVLAAFGGLAFYNTQIATAPLAAGAFARPQIARINTDGRVMMPAISPDGKYVAYIAGEAGSRSLVVRQVATDSTVTVVPPTNLNLQAITFSPTGDYVYYTQTSTDFSINTLYQVATLGGTPKKLIEDVDSAVTFSPDGKQFAFMRHKSDTNEDVIYTVNADTLAAEPLISTKATGHDFYTNRMAWSPDGKTILLGAGNRESGFLAKTDLVEILIAEKVLRPLAHRELFFVSNLVWFADGSGFLFAGRETQNGTNQIWKASYPDLRIEQVTNDFNDYLDVGVSTDGRSIVTIKGDTVSSVWRFSPASKKNTQLTSDSRNLEGYHGLIHRRDGKLLYTRSEGKEADIWIADGDGKNAQALLAEPGYSVAPVMTPDGRHVIFNLQKDKQSRIWRMDADGKNPVQLSEAAGDFVDFSPQVMPDGKTVVFQRKVGDDERFALMKVPVEGGAVEEFYRLENASIFSPRISPDGKRIAYSTFDIASFQKKLFVATLNGPSFGAVEREMEYNLINQFTWSPDGKTLTVLTNRGGAMNIWRHPVDGSAPTQLTDFKSGKILNFAWTADGKELIIARGNTNNDLILIRDTERAASGPTMANYPARRRLPFDIFSNILSGVR